MSQRDNPHPSLNSTGWIQARIHESIAIKQALATSGGLHAQMERVGNRLSAALREGNKVLFFGNGGSAADAQHLAGELVGRFYRERRGLPAIALTTDTSILTAIGNDYDYSRVFARQVEALAQPGDVAIGISTSGTSKNVLAAFQEAKARGVFTVGFTGKTGGILKEVADECLCVPSEDTPRIQEAHILIGHILCEWVENALFAPELQRTNL